MNCSMEDFRSESRHCSFSPRRCLKFSDLVVLVSGEEARFMVFEMKGTF